MCRLILNFENRMTLECASHPLPCSSFHQIHTPHGRSHWVISHKLCPCQEVRENCVLAPFVSGNHFVLFSIPAKHQCPSSVSFTAAERSLCSCFLSGVAAVGCAQATAVHHQGNMRSYYDAVVSTPHPPPSQWVRSSSYSSIQKKRIQPWSGSITHPPRPVLKTTSPATEDGWPKE